MKLTEKQSADLVRTRRKVPFSLEEARFVLFFLQFILRTYTPEITAGWRSILYTADAIENMYDSGHALLIFYGYSGIFCHCFFQREDKFF